MKFLTFVDLHEDRKQLKELLARAKKADVEFVVCAGDFSTFGGGMRIVLKQFSALGKKFYVIPGNHEESGAIMNLVEEYEDCINFDRQAVKIGEYVFLGYGGGGFSMEDSEFRKIARDWYGKYNGKKVVLVTHGPPFATKLDRLDKRHVGNKDYRKFIERIKPDLVVCGHLHETAGVTDSIGKTKMVNPGWKGKVIELK
jgi:uncharacterized protein